MQEISGLASLARATDRLLGTVEALDDEQVGAPSLLPGWSRLSVLTHLARNADGLRNRLLEARTGIPVAMYASADLRAADIEVGARRSPEIIREDLRAACLRFAIDAESLGPEDWSRAIDGDDGPVAATTIISRRLREVEAHHVDLGTAYTFADSPHDVLEEFLDAVSTRFAGSSLDPGRLTAVDLGRTWPIGGGDGPEVAGPAASLVAWAMGRGVPDDLTTDSGVLPVSPGWG